MSPLGKDRASPGEAWRLRGARTGAERLRAGLPAAASCLLGSRHLLPLRELPARRATTSRAPAASAHLPPPPIPVPGPLTLRSRAVRWASGRAPFLLGTGLVSLSPAATRVPAAQRACRRLRPRGPFFLFLGLLGGCLLPVLGHFSRDSRVREAPDGVFWKVSSGRRAAGPPGPPGPAALGAGAGEGALRTPPGVLPRSRGAGGRRGEKTPEGVKGRCKGRAAAPVLLCPPPWPPLHIGVPAPRPGVTAEPGAPDHTLRGEMLRPWVGGRGGREVGNPAGSARRRPRSRLLHVSLRLGPPSYTSGVPRLCPRTRRKLRSLLGVLSPGSCCPAPAPARGSLCPASRPPGPDRARARAPACAAAAAGREGEGGAEQWPRIPLAQVRAEVAAAASARGRGLRCSQVSRSRRQRRPEPSSLSRSLCAGLSPHSGERGGRGAARADDVSRLATALRPALRSPRAASSSGLGSPSQPPRPGDAGARG